MDSRTESVSDVVIPIVFTLATVGGLVYLATKLFPNNAPGGRRISRLSPLTRVSTNLSPLANTAGTTAIQGIRNNSVSIGQFVGASIVPQ